MGFVRGQTLFILIKIQNNFHLHKFISLIVTDDFVCTLLNHSNPFFGPTSSKQLEVSCSQMYEIKKKQATNILNVALLS